VPDENYLDPRLVRLYDALNPVGADTDFYLGLAGRHQSRILDIGCGTGTLAILLAESGHQVTGLDPAAAMIDVARINDVDRRVEWMEGDARSLNIDAVFDLVVMTGHVFQVFLTDADVAAVLGNARRRLLPEGVLAFETRNPVPRPWERWSPDASVRRIKVNDLGDVIVSYRIVEVTGDIVTFETTYRFVDEDEAIVAESSLRFLDDRALRERLSAAGFDPVAFYGDWDRSPASLSSPEIIVVARRQR
jgi:SAM-dependent methyltransferase